MALIFGRTEISAADTPSAVSLVSSSGVTMTALGIKSGANVAIETVYGYIPAILICHSTTTQIGESTVLIWGVATSDVESILDSETITINGVSGIKFTYVGYHTHSFDAFQAGITSSNIYRSVYSYAIDENANYDLYEL